MVKYHVSNTYKHIEHGLIIFFILHTLILLSIKYILLIYNNIIIGIFDVL